MYHRLARTDRYRWWKPIVELVMFVVLVLAMWLLLIPIVYDVVGPADNYAPGIIKLALTIACAMPAAFIAAVIVRRPWRSLLSIEQRFRGRWFGRCVAVALGCVLLSTGIGIIAELVGSPLGPTHGEWVGWDQFLPLALTIIVVIPLQASAEEFAFRGTLLQFLGAYLPWPAISIAITGVLFGVAHALPLEGFVAITTFGLVAAWLTIRTGGLEAAIALHVLNNVSFFLFDAATGRADRWVTELNTDLSWTATAIDVAINLLYAAIIAKLYARRA